MGGSGGGGFFSKHTPSEVNKKVREASNGVAATAFEATLSGMLSEMLGAFNSRDTTLVDG